MIALCNRADHYIFALWFLSSFFFFSSPNLSGGDWRLDVYHTSTPWYGLSANLECMSEMCCTLLAEIQDAKDRHFGTIAQLCRAVSSQLGHISTIEKNLLNADTSATCSHNMVNFGLLTAEICWRVWGTSSNFNGFRVLAALLHGTVVVGDSQTAALNRGRHLYSAGRPSRWALAHILVLSCFFFLLSFVFSSPNLSGRRSNVYHTSTHDTWCGPSANLECRSEMFCARLAGNAGPKAYKHIVQSGTLCPRPRAV